MPICVCRITVETAATAVRVLRGGWKAAILGQILREPGTAKPYNFKTEEAALQAARNVIFLRNLQQTRYLTACRDAEERRRKLPPWAPTAALTEAEELLAAITNAKNTVGFDAQTCVEYILARLKDGHYPTGTTASILAWAQHHFHGVGS